VTHDLTTFLDESRARVETSVPAQTSTNSKHFLTGLPEEVTYLSNILSKSTLVFTGTWDATTSRNAVLSTVSLPDDITINPLRMIIDNYTFLSGDLVVRIQFNGTPFHQGRLIAYWSPIYGVDARVVRASQMPNIEIDASTNLTQEIRIPFAHIYTCLNTYDATNLRSMGKLRFLVVNQLQYPTGSTPTLDYFVYVHFENAHVYNPTGHHTGLTAQASFDDFEAEAGEIGNLISETTTAIESAAVVAGHVGELLGFLDHPSLDMPSSERIVQDTTHGVGGVSSTTLDLFQGARCSMPAEYFPSEDDEMDLKLILSRPSIFSFQNWDTTRAVYYSLFTMNVNPHAFRFYDGIRIEPSPLAYFSYMFERWNGDIEVTFDIICTQFHRGQLGVAFVPAYTSAVPITMNDVLANPQYVLDLKSSHTFKITIPYTANTPWKMCPKATYNDPFSLDTCTGKLFIYVLNPLTAGNGVAENVDINVKVNTSPNFNFSYPRNVPTFTAEADFSAEADFEGGESSADGIQLATHNPRTVKLNAASYTRETRNEKLSHMKLGEILARPIYYVIVNPVVEQSNWYRVARLEGSPSKTRVASKIADMMAYCANCYFFFRGNMRFMVATATAANNPNLFVTSIRAPNSSLTEDLTNVAEVPQWGHFQHISHLAIKPFHSYDLPYINTHAHVISHNNTAISESVNPFYSNISTLDIHVRMQEIHDFYFTIFRSLGDTARLFFFTGCPTMADFSH
jgi:hypothetical protein